MEEEIKKHTILMDLLRGRYRKPYNENISLWEGKTFW